MIFSVFHGGSIFLKSILINVIPGLSEHLPASAEELSQCDGMTERKILAYGNMILDITRKFGWDLMEQTGDVSDPGEQEPDAPWVRRYFKICLKISVIMMYSARL